MLEPVTLIQHNFPLGPSLAEMGLSGSSLLKNTTANGNGSKLGLHHDVHNNCYYLLKDDDHDDQDDEIIFVPKNSTTFYKLK
jgi:hypothetical protein